jgi:4'-phosphopantetheinyl transferase EntD
LSAPAWEPYPFIESPHGVLRAVVIPDEPPSISVLARLTEAERALAASFSPIRLASFVAGRLALADALDALGAPRASLLTNPRGAPIVPSGYVGSVSHKRDLAVAIAARDEGAFLGVDLEEIAPARIDISRRVLTERERALLARFSIKESIYKAVDPFVQRYVGFKEADVDLASSTARLDLVNGEGPFAVEVTWAEIGAMIVSTARIRRT